MAGGESDYFPYQLDAAALYVIGIQVTAMLRVELIRPPDNAVAAEASYLSPAWRMAQFARVDAGSDSFWFDMVEDPRFGPTVAMIGRPDRLQKLLRGTSIAPGLPPSRLSSSPVDTLAVLYADWLQIETRLLEFAADFGISPASSRALVALFQTGDVRSAASVAGISYETAREYLDGARAQVGAGNLQRLVTLIGLGIVRTDSDAEESDHLLAFAYGLSERQMRIAGLIANGVTRREVATMLTMSGALVKKELAIVFTAIGVTSAVALARAMMELRLLAIAMEYEDSGHPFPAPFHHSLLKQTGDGRIIAANDYGPPSGLPTLVLHSSMTSRPVNRALVEALQNAGFRPVSLDRPGFGDTASAPETCQGTDYFDLAARDMIEFCAVMGWSKVRLVSRGAAQVITALHRIRPDLIEAAVVMNPDPDANSSSRRTGFLAAMKKNFVRRPWAVSMMARWVAQSMTFERLRDNVMRSVQGCPVDEQVMDRPANMADYYRGVAAFRSGKLDGFVAEQAALATMDKPAPLLGTPHFTLLVGEQDSIHDPAETLAYWREILPDASVSVAQGTGRFMSYSHPELVVEALSAQLYRRRTLP